MLTKQKQDVGEHYSPEKSGPDYSAVNVLAVGDPDEWQRNEGLMPTEGVAFLSFDEVTEAMMHVFAPPTVYSPAVSSAFDCIELALLLRHLGFSGAYRAVARDLPNPQLIEREVAQMCPQIDFKMVVEH